MDIREMGLNEDLLNKKEFVANGNKYSFVERTNLSIDRFQILHGYSEQIIKAMSNEAVNEILQKIKGFAKKNDMYSLSVYTDEQIQSNILYKSSPQTILEACCTFIVREGEDKFTYDPTISESKINDWKIEGLAYESFFLLLLTHTSKLSKIWSYFFQSILDQQKETTSQKSSETSTSS